MLLKDKVAIITGGAKGMGRSMAVKFAGEGCSVAIADIAVKEAEEAIAEIKNKGGNGLAIKCDITSGLEVGDAVDKVVKKYGKIDILVNNAGGITGSPPIEDMTEEEWDRAFGLNLKGDFFFCKYVVPHMKKAKYGKIINISSIGAVQPPAHAINYNTAKAGVIGFTLDLANALAPFNINVNVILPGPARTSFYDKSLGSMPEADKDKFFASLGNKTPLQRVGTPEDLAGAALFLASELSAWITGETLHVAGGLPALLAPGPPMLPKK